MTETRASRENVCISSRWKRTGKERAYAGFSSEHRPKYDLTSASSAKWMGAIREAMSQFTSEFRGIAAIEKEIRDLRARIDGLSLQPFTTTLAVLPKPYSVKRGLPVLIQPTGDDFVATLTDAGISATGDTEIDAISNLKDIILQKWEFLRSFQKEKIGRIPRQQLEALEALIERG